MILRLEIFSCFFKKKNNNNSRPIYWIKIGKVIKLLILFLIKEPIRCIFKLSRPIQAYVFVILLSIYLKDSIKVAH